MKADQIRRNFSGHRMTANYPGRCDACHCRFPSGTHVKWNRASSATIHADAADCIGYNDGQRYMLDAELVKRLAGWNACERWQNRGGTWCTVASNQSPDLARMLYFYEQNGYIGPAHLFLLDQLQDAFPNFPQSA